MAFQELLADCMKATYGAFKLGAILVSCHLSSHPQGARGTSSVGALRNSMSRAGRVASVVGLCLSISDVPYDGVLYF